MIIYLDSIGCRLNQSEIERYGREIRRAGHQLTGDPIEADIAIINTCAVTTKAAAESRALARRVGKRTRDGVILTGCWATLQPDEALQLPDVRIAVPNDRKSQLVHAHIPSDDVESELGLFARQPLPGLRKRTRAFIKVQDGCDLRCTFCVTTIARGRGRSVPSNQVIDDIRFAGRGAVKEIVLSGVHLGSWGNDLHPGRTLKDLIVQILDQTQLPRIRLSSLEPWDLDEGFFSLWENERMCRHLHLPLQSGSDRVLRRMARRTTTSRFTELVASARSHIPGVAITTDIIVGFPGETKQDFEQTLKFLEDINFAGGHVFTYSERSGTAAASFDRQVPNIDRKFRSRTVHAVLDEARGQFLEQHLGTRAEVLWEGIRSQGPNGLLLEGWTDNNIRVQALSRTDLSNEISKVRLRRISSDQKLIHAEILK